MNESENGYSIRRAVNEQREDEKEWRELEYLKGKIRKLAATYHGRSEDEIYVPAYRAACMEVAQELTKLTERPTTDELIRRAYGEFDSGIMSREEAECAVNGSPT